MLPSSGLGYCQLKIKSILNAMFVFFAFCESEIHVVFVLHCYATIMFKWPCCAADVDHHNDVDFDPESWLNWIRSNLDWAPCKRLQQWRQRERHVPVSRMTESLGFLREGTAGLFIVDHLQASHVFGPWVNKAEPPTAMQCSTVALALMKKPGITYALI